MSRFKRIDTPLNKKYRKNEEEENFIHRLNNILSPYHEEEYDWTLPDTYPHMFIIGAPRSGTTLLYQILAAHLDIGYVNNLIASFWRSPLYGIQLSKKLLPKKIKSSYHSDFGRTESVDEVHEFGYFWHELLGYPEMAQQDAAFEESMDWKRIVMVLNNMAHIFRRPMVHKHFLLAFHVQKMLRVMPKASFLHISRDIEKNAISILNARELYSGGVNNWIGPKPREYSWLRNETPWRQAVGQVYFLEKNIREAFIASGYKNCCEIRYEDICKRPREIIEKIQETFKFCGFAVQKTSEPPAYFRMGGQARSEEEHRRVREAIKDLRG